MPKKEVTGATPTDEEVTGQSPEEPAVAEEQTPDSNERLAKLEEELRSFAEKVEQEGKARVVAEAAANAAEEARARAERERDREVKVRIGHQRESGPKLQRLAQLEREQAERSALEEKLTHLEALIETMASNSLDQDTIEKINQRVAQSQRDKEIERLRAEVQQRSQPAQQTVAPELTDAWKKQLKDEYFPEFDVDPLELLDREWHQYDSRDSDHWKEQVRAEFEKHQNTTRAVAKTQAKEQDIQSLIAVQVAEAVRVVKEEEAKRLAETKAELDELRKAHEETKRLTEEQLNRRKGMDRDHESVSGPSTAERGVVRELAKLDPSALYSKDPKVVEAYLSARDNDKALRDRILENARRVQSQSTKQS